MDGTTATTGRTPTKLTMADIEAAVQKLRGMPPAKWMLVAPDGRVWSDENPAELTKVLAAEYFRLNSGVFGPFDMDATQPKDTPNV